VLVFSGSDLLVVARRDKDATRIRLSEAKALLVEVFGSPRLAEGLLLDELAADRMPWGSLLQKGEASDDFWKSSPRVNFEEDSASNTPKYRLFFVGGGIDHDDAPRGSEYFGIWLSRSHVLALLPESTDTKVPAPGTKQRPTNKRRAIGRPPDYPGEIICQVARDYIEVYGLPRTQTMLREKVCDECERNGFRVPKETRLKQLVDPIHKRELRKKSQSH
jgi:hypothetical protein